jgi:CheY-like chemotaxis protein
MHCLVVDPNVAFATLLSEELVRLGHGVTTCTSGAEAVAAAQAARSKATQQPVQLALLDMALQAPDALTLGHRLRTLLPSVRLVLIPMIGDDPVLGEGAPAIQGVLPKPFFLPELPERIEAALQAPLAHPPAPLAPVVRDAGFQATRQHPPSHRSVNLSSAAWAGTSSAVSEEATTESWDSGDPIDDDLGWLEALLHPDAPVEDDLAWLEALTHPDAPVEDAPPALHGPQAADHADPYAAAGSTGPEPVTQAVSPRALGAQQDEVVRRMRELADEVGADAVLLTSKKGVLAWVGSLDESEIISISGAVLESRRASEEVARVLGREQLRFEQSIAGGSYLLYALDIHDAVLAVMVSGSAQLGLLRHRTRAAGECIAALSAGA